MPSAIAFVVGKQQQSTFPTSDRVLRVHVCSVVEKRCSRPVEKVAWQSLFHLGGRVLTLLLPRSPLI